MLTDPSLKNMLDHIAQHKVFASLTRDELVSMSPILERRNFKEGEVVFDAVQRPSSFFLIESGSFILHLSNHEYKLLKPGELFGEIGVINGDFRSGSVSAVEPSTVIGICGIRLFEEKHVAPGIALKVVRALSKHITNYLRSKEQISTSEIIEQGENDYVEFKSTLRWNLFSNKKDKAIEKATLKTLVAFMNSEGGLLIIGVSDDGSILGLDNDQFPNHDKMLLHLTSLVKDRVGSLYLKFLHFSIDKIGNKEVLRIDCSPANFPAYLREDQQDHFFIRTGPSTTDLRLSKVYAYIRGRFDKLSDD